MTSPSTDRRYGVSSNTAIKAPCLIATTAAITLSGLQSIDGVTTVANDRVLVKNQSDATTNGIYLASTGDWTRDIDANGNRDLYPGTMVYVQSGTTYGDTLWRVSGSGNTSIVIGTDDVTWLPSAALAQTVATVADYGALPGATAAVNDAAFQAAFDAETVLDIPAGTYTVSTALTWTATGGVLELRGLGNVVLDATGNTQESVLTVGGSRTASTTKLAGAVTAGDTSFTTTLSGIAAGDIVELVSTDVFSAASASFVHGEMCRVLSVSGSGTFTINVETPLAASYTAANTTVHIMPAPKVILKNIKILRDSLHAGVNVFWAKDLDINGVKVTGAQERGFHIKECIGGVIKNCEASKVDSTSGGTNYGCIINSCQQLVLTGNAFISGRHGLSHGGTFPCRDLEEFGNVINNSSGTALHCYDVHANAEGINIYGNRIFNGLITDSVKNVSVTNNHIDMIDAASGITINQYDDGNAMKIEGNNINGTGKGVVFTTSRTDSNTTLDLLNISDNIMDSTGIALHILTGEDAYNYTITKLVISGNNIDNGTASVLDMRKAGSATLTADVTWDGNITRSTDGIILSHTGDFVMTGGHLAVSAANNYILDLANTGSAHVTGVTLDGETVGYAPQFDNTGIAVFADCIVKNMVTYGYVQVTSNVTDYRESNIYASSAAGTTVISSTKYSPYDIRSAEVTLTTAQVNNLRATPIELVPAPGAGFILEFVSAMLFYNYTTTAFTVGGDYDLVVQYDASTDVITEIDSAGFIDQTNDEIRWAPPTWTIDTDLTGLVNKKLELFNNGGAEFSDGGTSTLKVVTTYRVHRTGL